VTGCDFGLRSIAPRGQHNIGKEVKKLTDLLNIEELESLEAPGFWSFAAGFAAGVAVVAAGTAIGVAIT
jgi:hypothetical protein